MIRHFKKSFSRFSVLLCMFASLFSGCAQRPQVAIEGNTAPVFKISGQGNVQVLTVSGPDLDNPNSRDPGSRYMKPFWQIVGAANHDIAKLQQSGGIVYGRVPDGFQQVYPKNGDTPQPLVENELFTLDLRLANGEAVGMRFVIHNGKASIEGS